MANVELILLQRVEKLGQMGEIVKVKPGYARNYLLPQSKAVRATKANRERFERERVQLEALNLKRRDEAERVAERVHGLSITLIRQASDAGALYGSVSSRDISDACTAAGGDLSVISERRSGSQIHRLALHHALIVYRAIAGDIQHVACRQHVFTRKSTG